MAWARPWSEAKSLQYFAPPNFHGTRARAPVKLREPRSR